MTRTAHPRPSGRLYLYNCVFAALCLLAAMSLPVRACETGSSDTAFPLQVQPGKRYLVDARGQPFFMQGDSPWSLITQLTNEDADLYLRDRKARGFNTLLVNLLEHRFAEKAPANIYGDKPFLVDGDYSKPNEVYFQHADWVLRRACELGFVVLLAPSYLGAGGGIDGWYQEMKQNGIQRLADYGRFVGRRYANLKNIIWVQGGDYSAPDKDLVRAIAGGIAETDPDALQTAHNSSETAALDYWPDEPWLKINNVFTYGPVNIAAQDQYLRGGDMPFFLMETAYENEYDTDGQRVRMQAYQAILSGASGHLYGNNPIWHFDGPGLFPAPMGWKEALDSPGARSMSLLGDVILSVKWWLLEPDTDGMFLVGGQGGDKARVVAATARDRSFALVYLPTSKGVTLDLSKLSGPLISARWHDPTSGQVLPVEGSPFAPGKQSFRPMRLNQGGFTDWVLELTSASEMRQSQ